MNWSVLHRKLRQIAEAETIITNQIICTKCGSAGHIARDCVQKTPAEMAQSQIIAAVGVDSLPANTIVGRQDRAKMDSEYMSLMAELGQVGTRQQGCSHLVSHYRVRACVCSAEYMYYWSNN